MALELVVFDLDGVLVDSCDTHYKALNHALCECGYKHLCIDYDDHLSVFNGKPTRKKLEILASRGLKTDDFDKVWHMKQKITLQMIDQYGRDTRVCSILKSLKDKGLVLYCASNSIWATVKTILLRKGFLDYMDYFISNEEVRNPKPSSDMYYECMKRAKVKPSQCLIVEDSPVGLEAARGSGAHVFECTLENLHEIMGFISTIL